MSYAVIQTGGKQYKVKSGEIIKIEKLPDSKPNTKIEFKEVLAYGDDKTIEIGFPTINGAKVEANLIKNDKNRTVLIFKKRRRQNSRRKNGHRQQYSMIRIIGTRISNCNPINYLSYFIGFKSMTLITKRKKI